GNDYVGFLYAGLMIMADGTPKVIEYNCRFGDPETQPIMLRLKSDIVPLCQAACRGELAGKTIEFDERASVGVVLAAGGYPGSYNKGDEITGFEDAAKLDGKVFHAGTALEDGKVVTAGGRVLCATALGHNVTEAQQNAYTLLKTIQFKDVYFRNDIAHRAIAREAEAS
ncbi:MAG TPA: phosphoribosylamine--glycine ligase, partial [Alteromonas australica]|nr:phosphoribosylamine--glycine ligase [Alteromonas australica]HBF73556.1 phosphoribosylamine--glycine ligase [Alteromonas australica]